VISFFHAAKTGNPARKENNMSCPLCKKDHNYATGEALKRLAATGRRLDTLVSQLSSKKAASRPAPGKWSPKEIVCHLADCEIIYSLRYCKIIAEPGGILVAFDQDAWARSLKYREQSMKQAVSLFRVMREKNVALLKRISRQGWNRFGRHQDYGKLTLRQIVLHIADHDANHIAQLKRLTGK
jgi:hypothetical protein